MRKWILVIGLLFCFGCEQAFRVAPSERQKQNAELTHGLAKKINAEGTDMGSEASRKLVEGTRAELVYTGRAKTPPDPERFDTIVAGATEDASQRPDAWELADNVLELGIGIAGLLGGVYGLKAVKYLQDAKAKKKALEEIIKGNELFKDQQTGNGKTLESLGAAHDKTQSTETKKIVAVTKA